VRAFVLLGATESETVAMGAVPVLTKVTSRSRKSPATMSDAPTDNALVAPVPPNANAMVPVETGDEMGGVLVSKIEWTWCEESAKYEPSATTAATKVMLIGFVGLRFT
jgi:hypothetical protein